MRELNSIKQEEISKLEALLDKYPINTELLLPTRLGNVLRASEEYPYIRYGLEPITVWPRLWLLLSENTKKELGLTRQILNERMRIFTWSLAALFLWTPFAFLIALRQQNLFEGLITLPLSNWAQFLLFLLLVFLGALITYWGLLPAASVYGNLLRATFDLNRFALYKALSLPLPTSPDNEKSHGMNITMYLKRGMFAEPDTDILFQHTE